MKAKKSLGQHFLKCDWVLSTMIKSAGVGPDDVVLEIGPGTGILTRALAKSAAKVVAVEKDERLAEELRRNLRKERVFNVRIIAGDILKLDEKIILGTDQYKLAANIPYYLTSRLFRLLTERKLKPKLAVLTIQKEVAYRLCARPPKMNLLALAIQTLGKPEIVKLVPPECFSPKPKVESAIVKISDISDKFFKDNKINPKDFFEIAHIAFSQKRKQLAKTLKRFAPLEKAADSVDGCSNNFSDGGLRPPSEDSRSVHSLTGFAGREAIEEVLTKIGLSKTARPAELSLEQWVELVNCVKKAGA